MIADAPLQDPDRARGEPARWLVGWAARCSAIGAVIGVVLLRLAHGEGSGWWVGWLLLATSVAVAAVCVWHGWRHEHERGRLVAGATATVGFLVAMSTLYSYFQVHR